MPDDVVIKVENLSKQYRIGAKEGYRTFRETLVDAAKAPFARLRSALSKEHGAQHSGSYPMPYAPGSMPSSQHDDYIWALKNVSFEVKQGEVIGIIGRNGAGKSTLLKILSKITEPTEGRVELRGRVGSLLEVGTGFHPELTGHENVYLYGAILGMDRWEVTRKFDEIVAFAELEKFIDTPVKRYSSGMYMRLAFAVAAHMETEILLVDEVLAVGDVSFQKKCLGKMEDVSKENRSVLFVSHNIAAVTKLCEETIWIDQGRIVSIGPSNGVTASYLKKDSDERYRRVFPSSPEKPMCLRLVEVLDSDGNIAGEIEFSNPIRIALEYDINRPVSGAHAICFISNIEGVNVLGTGDADLNPERFGKRGPGRYRAYFEIPSKLLGEGTYTVTVSLGVPYVAVYDRPEHVLTFDLSDKTSKRRNSYHIRRPGVLGIEIPWQIEKLN